MKASRISFVFFTLTCFNSVHALDNLNDYVISAANRMVEKVSGRGYERHSSFTEALPYGKTTIAPSNRGKTMCVAAVAEALIRAIDTYASETQSNVAFEQLPAYHWTSGRLINLRAHLYQYKGANSGGPGDALSRLGIGEKVPFYSLRQGDLLAFSRRKTGHAVVFLGYIDSNGAVLSAYDKNKVVGFRYMSSQGDGLPDPYSGIGYRNAYFLGANAPGKCSRMIEDCGVINNDAYLNGGRLWSPERWDTKSALIALRQTYVASAQRNNPGVTRDALEFAIDVELQRELPEEYSVNFE